MSRFIPRVCALVEYLVVLTAGRLVGTSVVVRYLRNPNPDISWKLLRAFGAAVSSRATIKGSIFIDNVFGDANSTGDFSHLAIRGQCYVGDGVFFDLANTITIEDEAVIAGRVSFVTHAECKRSTFLNLKFPRTSGPIVVGHGAWIGFGATILSGTTIGEKSVVGANSLVLRDTEPHAVYVGSPATRARAIG